ncbi:hypothetical protein KZ305_24475 [Escherichia coli]|nr:hypothetical protein [Escherichia coli]
MKLKMQDLRLFNIVFESDPGWILDLSNRTLSAFFDEELNIDIDDERYQKEGTSKAKRVRCLLKQVDRDVTNGAIVIHTQRLKSDPGGNLLS